jgi:DNA-binding GntR family transcriptional regulator
MGKTLQLPVPGETLAEQAYRCLKQKIFDFEVLPGDRLSETELADSLRLSRTPLRQALQRLQHEGFVESVPKLGWVVATLRFDRLDALYDFRVLIECFAVRACCATEGPRPGLTRLAAIWRVEPAKRLTDALEVGALDEAFHQSLVEEAHNPEIAKTHREITERIRIVRRLDFTMTHRIEATYQEHSMILKALLARRSTEAERLLTAHIEQSKIEVRKITLDTLYRARSGQGRSDG